MSKQKYCYLNGKIISVDEARISPLDIGLLRGYGVFDFLRTSNGKLFLFAEHYAKFKKAVEELALKIPLTDIQLEHAIKLLIKKNNLKEASLRIVLTGGASEDSMTFAPQPTFLILAEEFKKKSSAIYEKGVKLISVEYHREVADAKVLNYIIAVRAQNTIVKKEKAFETLYISNGLVLEAATSNFFVFKGDILITPKNNVFKGVTRNLVIKLADKNFKVEERDISVEELKSITEAFITGSSKEIVPVVKIDKITIGNGKVGKNTKQLMGALKKFLAEY